MAPYDWRRDATARMLYEGVKAAVRPVDRAVALTDLCDYMVRAVARAGGAVPVRPATGETELLTLLSRMLEPFDNDCRRDHHGYCQAHFLELDCSVARSKAALASRGSVEYAPELIAPERARGCPTKILEESPSGDSAAVAGEI